MSEAKVKLFHPNGAEVFLPIPEDFTAATHKINHYTQSGWAIRQPERMLEQIIGYVAKRSRIDERTGYEVPILDLYATHEKMTKRFIVRYINTEQQAKEFEAITGLKIEDIPLFDGAQPVEKGTRQAEKYIVALPFPVKISYKDNPKYNKLKPDAEKTKEEKKIPARLFVNWLERVEVPANPTPASPAKSEKNDSPKSTSTKSEPKAGAGSNEHWATIESNRTQVANAFAEYKIIGKPKVLEAIQEIERNKFGEDIEISKLTETKFKTVEEYLSAIRQLYEEW